MGCFQRFSGNRWERIQLKELDSGRGTSNRNSISIGNSTRNRNSTRKRNRDRNSTRNRHGNDKKVVTMIIGVQDKLRTR